MARHTPVLAVGVCLVLLVPVHASLMDSAAIRSDDNRSYSDDVAIELENNLLARRSTQPVDWCKADTLIISDIPGRVSADGITEGQLAVIYVLPTDVPYDSAVHARLIEATKDVQAWYQCATGGLTWELAYPEIVRVYYAQQERQYYVDNGNWWGSLLGEMDQAGQPIWEPGVVTNLWAHGAGFWAGGAQSCGGECGVALVGVELFPEFNNPAYSGGDCPVGEGVAAWPCTPLGAFAHELGHTLGLPHPVDVPETAPDSAHSIMQTHWNYPDHAPQPERPWGFLTLERQALLANPFAQADIELTQTHAACDVVNLPDNGPAPVASFEIASSGLTITTTNSSVGGTLYYWTFGDGAVSNETGPTHEYATPGTYEVRLRVSGDNSMMDQSTDLVIERHPLGVIPDLDDSGASELAVLYTDPATGDSYVYVKDALTGDLIKEILAFGPDYSASAVVALSDFNNNDAAEIAIVGTNRIDGRVLVRVHDALSGQLLSNISFSANYPPRAAVAIPSFDDSDADELGLLGIRSTTGQVLVRIKDAETGVKLSDVYFSPNYAPRDVVVIPDFGGTTAPEIAVLGARASPERVMVRIKDAASGLKLNDLFFSTNYPPQELLVIPDYADGPAAEVGVLGTHRVTAGVLVRVKDASSGTKIDDVYYSARYVPRTCTVVSDFADTVAPELSLMGIHDTTSRVMARVKDASSGVRLSNVWFSENYPPEAVVTVPNVAGSAADEIALLGRHAVNGNVLVRVKDASTGELIVAIPIP